MGERLFYLSNERRGEIALACLKIKCEQQGNGLSSENFKRELGHLAKEIARPLSVLMDALKKGEGEFAGEIAWKLLISRRVRQGIKFSPSIIRRELGNLAKEAAIREKGISFDELEKFSFWVLHDVLKRTFPGNDYI